MSRLAISTTISVKLTDAPKWLSHIEIENDGETVTIQTVRIKGYAHSEAQIDAKTFFRLIEKLKDN